MESSCGCGGNKNSPKCTCVDCKCGPEKSCCQVSIVAGCTCGTSCTCGPNCTCGPSCICCSKTASLIVATIRKPAPQFETMAYWNGFKKVSLSDFKGKYLVLFFYPLDFTFVCPTEIVQFSDKAKEFRDAGCEVIGCSGDSHFTHMEYTKKDRKKGGLGKMDIPLLSDVSHSIASKYGCLIRDGPDAGVALRATYIIDKDGIVRHISMNDLPVGRSIDEVLRLVKAFMHTDEFGEVCPASWRPGGATMEAETDSKKTQDYWEKEHGKGQ